KNTLPKFTARRPENEKTARRFERGGLKSKRPPASIDTVQPTRWAFRPDVVPLGFDRMPLRAIVTWRRLCREPPRQKLTPSSAFRKQLLPPAPIGCKTVAAVRALARILHRNLERLAGKPRRGDASPWVFLKPVGPFVWALERLWDTSGFPRPSRAAQGLAL